MNDHLTYGGRGKLYKVRVWVIRCTDVFSIFVGFTVLDIRDGVESYVVDGIGKSQIHKAGA